MVTHSTRSSGSLIEERPHLARAARMLELPERLGLDLADALAGDAELLADLLERVVGVHADAEAHAQHALLARRERSQHPRRGLAEVALDRRVDRQDRVVVLDEVAEVRVLLVADRGFERQRLLGDLERLAHPLQRRAKLLRDLLRRGLADDLVDELEAGSVDLVACFCYMHSSG